MTASDVHIGKSPVPLAAPAILRGVSHQVELVLHPGRRPLARMAIRVVALLKVQADHEQTAGDALREPFFVVIVGGLIVSGVFSWIVGVGSTTCVATLRLGARMARFDQRRLERLAGARLDPPRLPQPASDARRHERSRAWIGSPAAWRLVACQLVRLPVAGAAALLVFGWWRLVTQVLGWWPNLSPRAVVRLGPIACVVAWPFVVRVASSLDLLVVRWLLAPSRARQLSAEVERLGLARGEAIAVFGRRGDEGDGDQSGDNPVLDALKQVAESVSSQARPQLNR